MANPLAPFTLVAATAKTFTLDEDYDAVRVVRFAPGTAGTDEIFITVDGSTPTVDGAGCEVMGALTESVVIEVPSGAITIVRCISSGTPKVSVRGL